MWGAGGMWEPAVRCDVRAGVYRTNFSVRIKRVKDPQNGRAFCSRANGYSKHLRAKRKRKSQSQYKSEFTATGETAEPIPSTSQTSIFSAFSHRFIAKWAHYRPVIVTSAPSFARWMNRPAESAVSVIEPVQNCHALGRRHRIHDGPELVKQMDIARRIL
jgi:hypothetical protein